MGSQFIQLEEFDEPFKSRRICAYLPSNIRHGTTDAIKHIRLIVSNVQAGGEPFLKIICLTGDPIYRLLADSLGASMIIGPKDNQDLSIILTAVNQAPTNSLLIIFPDVVRCPEQFFQRLPAASTVIILRPADDNSIINTCNIFMMPYVRDIESAEHHAITRRMHALGIAERYDFTAILKELRMAHAGLLVSIHTEPASLARRHELYWWNTAEELPHIRRRPEVIADLLRFIADIIH